RYYLQALSLSNGARLTVAAGQTVQLFVEGSVTVANNSTLGPPLTAAGSLLVVSGADATRQQVVTLENSADAAAQVDAPLADIALANATGLAGAGVGRHVSIRNRNTLSLAPGPQAVPPPLTCP